MPVTTAPPPQELPASLGQLITVFLCTCSPPPHSASFLKSHEMKPQGQSLEVTLAPLGGLSEVPLPSVGLTYEK